MSEEIKERVEAANNVQDDSTVDYISAINEMRQNTVERSAYEKLKDENKRLLQSLVNGETIQQTVEPVDVKKLRAELYGSENDYSNLDYWTKTLQLRNAIIEQGGIDPFLPYGKNIAPTDEDIATANRVAEVVADCIEYAEGDSSVFTNELQRRMVDTAPKRR